MEALVSLGKALSDPARVRIIALLLRAEACVCEMVDALDLGQSSVSSHLQILRASGLVETERRRNWVIYSLSQEARHTLAPLFASHGQTGEMRRDMARFERRLGIRVDGCCTVGTRQLPKEA